MQKYLSSVQISDLAILHGYEPAALHAVIDVESSGHGFSSVTGKIIIQFEPQWFKREKPDWKNYVECHTWQTNKVSNQTLEWIAFNDAFSIDKDATMQSTSIGLMQVMGFHYKALGFKTVGAMWDFAKESEANQLELGIRFIKSNPELDGALKNKKWSIFAYFYNGKNYKEFHYDSRLGFSYTHYKENNYGRLNG